MNYVAFGEKETGWFFSTDFAALYLPPLGEPKIFYLRKSVKICVPFLVYKLRRNRYEIWDADFRRCTQISKPRNCMKITEVITDFYHVPLAVPLSDSIHGEMPYFEMHLFAIDDYIAHPFALEGGDAVAPDRPGHGVELDFAKLEPHRVAQT